MDWNNDGKKDLITGERDGYIRIYLNTGTDQNPAFNGHSKLQVGGSNFDCEYSSKPDVVDWNNDGKKDVLCGDDDGRVHLLLNSGTDANPSFLSAVYVQNGSPSSNLTVPSRASPVATDWNGDGKKDLIVGETGGRLYYFENTGTDAAPAFNGSTILTADGSNIDVNYYSRPDVADWDNDGTKDILCGCYESGGGRVWLFKGIGPMGDDRSLRVTVPGLFGEGEGVRPDAGKVRISGTLAGDVAVALSSGDTSELTVPAGAIIPAGSVMAPFDITVVDDPDHDGVQEVSISARAATLVDGTGTTSVADSEVDSLTMGTISSPRTVAVPFAVSIVARDIDGAVSSFAGSAGLSGSGDGGSVEVSPFATGLFSWGQWNGNVSVDTVDTQVRLVAEAAGHSVTSGVFDVNVGALDHFQCNLIASPQIALFPFDVSISARDANDYIVTSFDSGVDLAAAQIVVPGTGSSTWDYPMMTYFHDARTQVIYPVSLIGGPGRITSLALDVTELPEQAMKSWTIRMKHTAMTEYSATPAWETAGWTVVYQHDETVAATGWTSFELDTPFDYNGSDSLMIDFSFNNSSYTDSGLCRYTATAETRSIYYRTDSQYGDPLTWAGTNNPVPIAGTRFPNIRLVSECDVTAAPPATGAFTDGVWTGAVAISGPHDAVTLGCADGSSHRGNSNPFQVLPSDADLDHDGMADLWEWRHFGGTGVSFGTPSEDQDLDSFPDLHECWAGTDPTNNLSFLALTAMELEPGPRMVISWCSESNRTYKVDISADLTDSNSWTTIEADITATPPLNVYTDDVVHPVPAVSYRVGLDTD